MLIKASRAYTYARRLELWVEFDFDMYIYSVHTLFTPRTPLKVGFLFLSLLIKIWQNGKATSGWD